MDLLNWLVDTFSKVDTWVVVWGFIYAAALGGFRFAFDKLGLKLQVSLKPPPPPLPAITPAIDGKLVEVQQKNQELRWLFDVSKSQWEEELEEKDERIRELEMKLAEAESSGKQ